MRSLKPVFTAHCRLRTGAGRAAQTGFGPPAPRASQIACSNGWCRRPIRRRAAHALLFRPPGDGPFRLAVIAHATTQNVLRRAQMPQPDYKALAAWLVARGFAVLVPERLGHGATGGKYLEDQGGCDEADYISSGRATADQISGGAGFSAQATFHPAGWHGCDRPFRRRVGRAGAGGAKTRKAIALIIAFAPGRGGHANDFPNLVCAPHTLLAGGEPIWPRRPRARSHGWCQPMIDISRPHSRRQLADAFRAGGGKVDFRALPALWQRGPLAAGDRGRREACRPGTGSCVQDYEPVSPAKKR